MTTGQLRDELLAALKAARPHVIRALHAHQSLGGFNRCDQIREAELIAQCEAIDAAIAKAEQQD